MKSLQLLKLYCKASPNQYPLLMHFFDPAFLHLPWVLCERAKVIWQKAL